VKATLRAYQSLTTANIKMYLRNPIASFSLFAALIVLLILFKLVFDGPGPHTKVLVVNSSSSAEAAALVKDLRSVGTFDVSDVSSATASTMLGQGKADVEVLIPTDFLRQDASGSTIPSQLRVTYRSSPAGQASLPVIRGVVELFDESVLHQVPLVSMAATSVNTSSSSAIDALLPGIVAFNIIGSALMLAAGTFANYKSTGVMRRVKGTGISPSVFVLSHATASAVIGFLQTAAILVVASLLFAIHLDLVSLFLLLALGYLVFLAMGLAIGGWVKDPQRATGIAQGVAFPMIFVALLSSSLPPGIADLTRFLPVSYVTDGMQHLSDGGAIASVAADIAWLFVWAMVLLVGAGRVFRWD
jgi:ABC-2 type transport system permease protein